MRNRRACRSEIVGHSVDFGRGIARVNVVGRWWREIEIERRQGETHREFDFSFGEDRLELSNDLVQPYDLALVLVDRCRRVPRDHVVPNTLNRGQLETRRGEGESRD